MHYPRPPRRPQAVRVRSTRRRRAASRGHSLPWFCCVVALGLVGIATIGGSSSATAAERAVGLAAGVSTLKESDRGAAAAGPPAARLPATARAERAAASEERRPAEAPKAGATLAAQSHHLLVELTAYSALAEEGTAWGITRTGVPARVGTVAVDPAVIPLGSRLRLGGFPGVYRAEDTGGGIRGAHVDVFMESRAAALAFGRRSGVLAELLD